MNPLKNKFKVQIQLANGRIINKEFTALNDLDAIDKAYIYAKINLKENILDVKYNLEEK